MENKKITGYIIEHTGIFLSRGKAIDNSCRMNNDTVDYFTTEIECLAEEDLTAQYQLRRISVVERDTNKVLYLSPWVSEGVYQDYLSAAWKLLDGTCFINFESIRFDATMYEEPKFPQSITFQIDDRGRMFTRIQTQPNIYGQSTPGKIFFPDKSWTGAIFTGNAICRIVKELDNYGFITGHMCPYPSVSLDEFLDYLWEHKIYRDDVVITCYKVAGMDTLYYGVISDWGTIKDSVIRIRQFVKDDWNCQVYLSQTYIDYNAREFDLGIQWQKKLGDLWLAEATNGKITMDMLEEEIKPATYFVNETIKGKWVKSYKTSNNELIDDAIEEHIFALYNLSGYDIFCLDIDPSMFGKLSAYTVAEIHQLIKDVSEFNYQCDEQITAKLKRGHIALNKAS